jgi:predicted ribosomally synthesized peptide with SipW-like signal peptide
MTDDGLRLTRRKVLGSLGAVGVGSVGAGLGTTAFFSDEESFDDNALVAGELDLKVDWQEYYSDWSDDEAEGLEFEPVMDLDEIPDNDPDGLSPNPTNPENWIGFPPGFAELIYVWFGDVVQFMKNTATEAFPDENGDGIQDRIESRSDINEEPFITDEEVERRFREQFADVPDDLERPLIDISDVKPGDFGQVTFSVHLFENPAYLWLTGGIVDSSENRLTEPEAKDPDEEEEVVELLDEIRTAVWHDNGNGVLEPTEELVYEKELDGPDDGENTSVTQQDAIITQGTLRDVLTELELGDGIPLDSNPETTSRDCFPNSTTRYLGFAWWLPVDHANEIQTDSVEFDLGFYTEQCRHNDGSGEVERVALGSDRAEQFGFASASGDGALGSGYWTDDPDQTNQEGDFDEQLYVTFDESFGPYYVEELAPFTVGDIASIGYRTRGPAGVDQDYYLELYTMPDDPTDEDVEPGDDASWYGRLLQALPGDALNRDVTADEWTTWRTEAGPNQLTWYDHNHDYDTTDSTAGDAKNAYLGVDTGVTLLDLQSTPQFDWSDYVADADATSKNYRDEQVRAIRFATGSGWEDSHEGDLDAIEIRLTDGRSALVDLEP